MATRIAAHPARRQPSLLSADLGESHHDLAAMTSSARTGVIGRLCCSVTAEAWHAGGPRGYVSGVEPVVYGEGMAEVAVIVNGVPGAGKTTLCAQLGPILDMPVVSKDALKEALAEAVPVTVPTSALGAIASDALWAVVGVIQTPVIVESFWISGRDERFFEAGLRTAGILSGVEVWCEAPVDVMRDRFLTRPRHFAHDDARRVDEWESMARSASPVSGFPVLRVDTVGHGDVPGLVREVRRALAS